MADILLSVGAQLGKLDTSQFQKDIEAAVSKLNGGKPPVIKVKMEVDPASISNFQSQIQQLLKSTGGKSNVIDALGLASLAGIASDLKAATDAMKNFKQASSGAGKTGKDSMTAINNAITQATNKMTQLEKVQDRIAKGKGGTSSQAYQDITAKIAQIDELVGKLQSRQIDLEKFREEYSKIGVAAAKTNNEIQRTGAAATSGLSVLESRFLYMFSLSNLILKAVAQIRKMVSTTIELDSAMTQLRVVTNASDSDISLYGKAVASTAKQIGASMTDLIYSATVFARLGYTLDESAGLAKYTKMLANVGDIDVSSAQSALTAITKAFGINASEIESVMDKMVVVGNNYPISVAELAEGMNNAGSALDSAGNTFEQSIALLTAANTTVQNISKSSTGLRTITARIRKTDYELNELGETIETAKYQEALDILTKYKVALTDNGEYRSTYEILQDIAGVWKELTSMEQAAIAEQLAGKMLLLPERIEMCA